MMAGMCIWSIVLSKAPRNSGTTIQQVYRHLHLGRGHPNFLRNLRHDMLHEGLVWRTSWRLWEKKFESGKCAIAHGWALGPCGLGSAVKRGSGCRMTAP